MKKQMENFRQQTVARLANSLIEGAQTVNGVKVVKAVLPVEPASAKTLFLKCVLQSLKSSSVYWDQLTRTNPYSLLC